MNNESINFSKIITTVSNTATSANNNCANTSINSSATPAATQFSSTSSPLSLLSASVLSSPQPYSSTAQFDVTVNAIAAVVNASNNLPVITPPNAAAVVAVAVSSLAAAIIPDTPIVSIAGSTLSEITTTTTSTKTTPTPIPTSKETDTSNKNTSSHTNVNNNNDRNFSKDVQNKTLPSSSTSSSYSPARAAVKGIAPMSVANSSVSGVLTNASNTAANAGAVEIKSNTNNNSIKPIKDTATGISTKGSSTTCGPTPIKSDSLATPPTTESKSITATTLSPQPVTANAANVSVNKIDDSNVTPNQTKSKDSVSELWDESRLKDWEDSKLKELLDEAYSYKNPRDKENKSKTFLQLLEKAENEDQSYPFCVTSRGTRNLATSLASNSYHHYQPNSHYHSHSHNNNSSQHHHHHHYKQGGSLQDLFEIGLHESPLDCDQTFGIGISGNQRTRRQNHNSRQKKYSSSVSSRQREGGSLPSNVNVTHQLSIGGSVGVANDISLLQQDTNTIKASKKEQRRNAVAAAAAAATKSTTSTAVVCADVKENYTNTTVGETVATNKTTTTTTTHPTYTASGDFIIEMGDPILDIQQQQKILHCKGQDAATQGHPFYERLLNAEKRIPRANIVGSAKNTYFAPTTSHCYVDDTVRFNALERNGNGGSNNSPQSAIDAKFLPLDDNYKSCKSVLGSDSDKSPELLNKTKTNAIYTKISTPASGSAILTGTTNNIATMTQRQLDENGNALGEIYQNSQGSVAGTAATIQINAVSPANANATAAALLNSCGGNVSTSATVTISPHTASTTVSTSATVTTTFTSGPSQAKAKAKKKSQQERNTKTVDVESVAGYRGKDPVEELVKYIESSGEDKQTVAKSSGDKKKERKKDKEKHQKLKKSNSLEELRSGAKMEVHELKRTAATTESNTVLVRQKSHGAGGGGGGGKKNSSSSTADINKNLDANSSSKNATNPRKSERRSWGNEDLKYSEDQQNANSINEDPKSAATAGSYTKEKKTKIGSNSIAGGAALIITSKEEKEIKDKTNERNERNLANNLPSLEKLEKVERSDRPEKTDKFEKIEKIENKLEKRKKQTDIPPNAVTVVDILAIESVLPETAEFHVVTKKKKPKKQKVINNLEETTVTFNRTHNFTMQKTSTFNQQQQQMTVRYKYYHHDNATTNNTNTGNSTNNTNANSQSNQQPSNTQQQQQQHQPQQTFAANNSNQMQNALQQQHSSPTDNYGTVSDKSRRKSTSSVPPSEKSDSSDLDSVHSLPIEATTKPNHPANAGTNSHKTKMPTRSKPMKNNTSNPSIGKGTPPAVPISYADIARTNKEIADAAANTGSASVILINNNEISSESRNADMSLTSNESVSCDEKSLPSAGNNSTATSPSTPPNLNAAAALKSQKMRKSQIKQDFPELSSSTAANVSDELKFGASNNPKTIITYSQSLTTVQNINTNPHSVGGGSCAGAANDSFHAPLPDHNAKVSPTEHQKPIMVHQQAFIPPPLQHPQKQILQKSKSVENDNNVSSTPPSSSSLSSNAVVCNSVGSYTMNSNNLDQQYPALEKTFKRHIATNATATMGAPTPLTAPATGAATATPPAPNNNSQQTPFNFAAAAKQQINSNNSSAEQYNLNLNKTSNLTTSNIYSNNNNNNNTNQVTLTLAANNKRSKEKTPPLTASQQHAADVGVVVQVPTTLAVNAQTNPKKTKRERQQSQQQQTTSVDLNLNSAKQNQNPTTQKKALKNPLKTSNSLPLGLNSSLSATSSGTATSSLSLHNRPAVIILNDYRNAGSCAADNQFTFGDFNEEELKLFDDDHSTSENLTANMSDINLSQGHDEQQLQSTTRNEAKQTSISSSSFSSANAYFNDSVTSCESEVGNNSNSDILSSSIEQQPSSPNSNTAIGISNCAGLVTQLTPGHSNNNNNQSSDSGIYMDKTKSSSIDNSSEVCKTRCSSSVADNTLDKQKHQPKEENDKLNTFLSKTKCPSNHASMDNLSQQAATAAPPPPPSLLPPQQLETCNDIETAIIAAARAAAKQQQPNQQQQQQYKNSNNSSNSSSFSSSSLATTTKTTTTSSSSASAPNAYKQQQVHHHQQSPPRQHHHQHQHQQQHHHHQHHQQQQQQLNHSNNSNKYGRGAFNHHMSSYHHQSPSNYQQQTQQQQYDDDDDDYINNEDDHDTSFSNNRPRSHSPSRPRRISIAGGTVARKEFDIHFIPPTTMPTAFSTQQHNDIIVDFIGSAWEEVKNSKVTKVYDGQ